MSHHKLFHLKTGFFKAGHFHIHPYAMGVQVLLCVPAFLVVCLSLESAYARPSNNQNVTDFDSGKVIVKGNYNAVNLYPEKDVKTALSRLEKNIESLEGRLDVLEKFKSGMSVF